MPSGLLTMHTHTRTYTLTQTLLAAVKKSPPMDPASIGIGPPLTDASTTWMVVVVLCVVCCLLCVVCRVSCVVCCVLCFEVLDVDIYDPIQNLGVVGVFCVCCVFLVVSESRELFVHLRLILMLNQNENQNESVLVTFS